LVIMPSLCEETHAGGFPAEARTDNTTRPPFRLARTRPKPRATILDATSYNYYTLTIATSPALTIRRMPRRPSATSRRAAVRWVTIISALALVVASVVLIVASDSSIVSRRSLALVLSVENEFASNRRMMEATTKTASKVRVSPKTVLSTDDATSKVPNEDVHNNNNKSNRKPRFVWHVGAMKTATTTLQLGLGGMSMSGTLKRDNWVYTKFSFLNDKEQFWPTFQTTMQDYHQQGVNVVASSENFSVFFRTPDYQKVQELLQDDWDVEVVIGYRPYFEWVPSHWAQAHKLRTMGHSKPNEPIPDVSWKNDQGNSWKKPVTPMFPDFYDRIGPLFANSIYDFASPHLPVTMLHMYDQPLRTKFVCDILRAKTSCARSRKKDSENKTTHANGKSLDEIHVNAIVMEAAAREWIDMEQWSRATLMTAVMEHLSETRHQSVFDLPFTCPDQATLEKLLWDKTVTSEQKIFPQLAASEGRVSKLREGFQKLIDRKTYCRLDLDTILNDAEWQAFFAQYNSSSKNNKAMSVS